MYMHILQIYPNCNTINLGYTEYLHAAYDLSSIKKNEEICLDKIINLSYFVPGTKSQDQVIRLNGLIKKKWGGDAIRKEINGLFDHGTFLTSEITLPTDEVIPVKLALKAKMNAHGGLDEHRARFCLRGDTQIKDESNPWSPTASSRLFRYFIVDTISHKAIIYQLNFIQAFIQSEVKKRMCVVLDKEYEQFCLNQNGNFGRFLRLKRCLYGGDFSAKSWYGILDMFLTLELGFTKSRVEACLYICRNNKDWIQMINYVNDTLHYANNDQVRLNFEKKLSNRFHLSLLGKAKCYLETKNKENKDNIKLDQDQHIKIITSRFEKSFKHLFKG